MIDIDHCAGEITEVGTCLSCDDGYGLSFDKKICFEKVDQAKNLDYSNCLVFGNGPEIDCWKCEVDFALVYSSAMN